MYYVFLACCITGDMLKACLDFFFQTTLEYFFVCILNRVAPSSFFDSREKTEMRFGIKNTFECGIHASLHRDISGSPQIIRPT
jgi:hypothetical protein